MPFFARVSVVAVLCAAALARGETTASPVVEHLLPYHIIEGQAPYSLAERMEHYHVPGVGIAVIENFEVVWTGYYGVAAAGSDQAVTPETLFGVGSLSKAVTAACALRLARAGAIDLDGDINPQLRSWQLPDHAWSATSPVTPALLMNHSGGLPHRQPFTYPADGIPTALQMVQGVAPARGGPLLVTMEPGRSFQYSNGGFTILQLLIEDAGGRPFAEAADALVFGPLGMGRTTFANPLPVDRLERAAWGHRNDGRRVSEERVYMAHVAAGGLWTTAEDYARFVIGIQEAAAGRSDAVLDQALARRMLTPGPAPQYGLGVFMYEGDGQEPFFSHIGDGAGFVAGFVAHRTDGFGAVITTNGMDGINLCREVMRSVARVYDWQGYLPPARREIPLTADELHGLAGRYLAGFDDVVRLEADGGRLRIHGEGLSGFTLFRVAADTLVAVERNGEIALDRGGPQPALRLHLADAIGRLGDDITTARRLSDAELSPLEQLLAADEPEAYAPYLELAAAQPEHPALDEPRFNRMGYEFMARSRLDDALRAFKLNTLLHPDSGNVFDSYGEALLAAGRTAEARANYERSLQLDPGNSNAAGVLERLRAETAPASRD